MTERNPRWENDKRRKGMTAKRIQALSKARRRPGTKNIGRSRKKKKEPPRMKFKKVAQKARD